MSQIFNRLTIRHFRSGWSIYWRIGIPFWIHLGYVLSIFFLSLFFHDYGHITKLSKHTPKILEFPFVINILAGIIVYLAGFPFFRKCQRFISRKCESDFYRSQFAIFSSLDKFNRSLMSFLLVFVIFLIARGEQFREQVPFFWLWLFLLALILAGVVANFVSLYGWLGEQFGDIREESTHG